LQDARWLLLWVVALRGLWRWHSVQDKNPQNQHTRAFQAID
jgi:hypothetical protein